MLEVSEQLEHLKLAAEVAGLEVPRFALPADHDVVVNRMRFHYLDWGTAGRHPLLFLHGGGLNAHTWDLVCLALRGEYHCLALDQRGHGDSEWSPVGDYSLPSQVRDVEDFIEKLGLERPLMVGHSMGGFAAMAYAAKFAHRMAGLVLVDIAPELNPSGTARIRNFLALDRELDSVDAFVERAMAFNPLRNPALLRRSLLHNLRELPNGKWTWKHDPNRAHPTPESTARTAGRDHERGRSHDLPDAGAARREERRADRRERGKFRERTAERALDANRGCRAYGAGRQSARPGRSAAPISARDQTVGGVRRVCHRVGGGKLIRGGPMRQIKSFGVLQTSKVMGAVYFSLGLLIMMFFFALAMIAPHPRSHAPRSLVMFLFAPVLYGVAGFIGTAIMCWLYNAIAKRIGGIEFEVSGEPGPPAVP